jgi:hypothetical protein
MFAGIFFFFFLFFLFLIVIGGSLLRGILNFLFGRRTRRHQSSYNQNGQQQTGRQSGHSRQNASDNNTKREKIFDKNDGEYVDFEEIKE